ncbi:hypothetical protein [Micromonospora sp. IBHARD004]|uniref:hypothetical protein n=1 Tax=Micromonospora sp. IBHARD004 TaxID=3457764 RepID=UPI004058DDB3
MTGPPTRQPSDPARRPGWPADDGPSGYAGAVLLRPAGLALRWLWRHTVVPLGRAVRATWRHTAVPLARAVRAGWRATVGPTRRWVRRAVLDPVRLASREVLTALGLRR